MTPAEFTALYEALNPSDRAFVDLYLTLSSTEKLLVQGVGVVLRGRNNS